MYDVDPTACPRNTLQTSTFAFDSIKVKWAKLQSFTSNVFMILHAKNYWYRPMFHGVIQK